MAKKKHLPIINYDVRTVEEYDMLTNSLQVKKHVYDHMIQAVEYGINAKKEKVDLFRLQDSDKVLVLEKTKWKDTLNNAISFYSDIDEYEKCIDCQYLLSQLQ